MSTSSQPPGPGRRRPSHIPPRRRGRTRWLLITPVLGLAAILTGVVALQALAPVVEEPDTEVAGVPGLADPEVRSCARGADDQTARDLREAFPAGGRISSTQVFACPSAYDGLRVTYVGEVVGELLPRDGGAWAQVNDDPYALEVGPLVGHRERRGSNTGMSVWLPDEFAERIAAPGRPERRGDVIQLEGTLLRTDPHDGGGITIRADGFETLAEPLAIEDPLHVPQLVAAVLLALLALVAVFWSRRAQQRR